MIKRDWLLGVGLLSGSLGVALGVGSAVEPALAQSSGGEIGAVAAVKPDAFGQAPSAAEQTLTVGAGLVENEKIRTNPDGTTNVIFADRSTLTVGKGSEVTLDKFVYDPNTHAGGLAINLATGTLRFVGGQLSKTGAVQVKTPTATMTVRGGIGLFYFPPGGPGYAVFLYGKELKNLDTGDSIYRPGFAFMFPAGGGAAQIIQVTDALLQEIELNFNYTAGLGGAIPDEKITAFANDIDNPEVQQLITDLRGQIDDLSQRDRVIFDASQRSGTPNFTPPPPPPPVIIPPPTNPYTS